MPKSQFVDPAKAFEAGYIHFEDIPVCQYNKTLDEEKALYTKEDFMRIYRDMAIIREFETMLNEVKVKSEYNGVQYNNPGPAHLSIGQEASAVGEAYALDINDFSFGSHRSHGEILAKGLSSIHKLDDAELYDIMKEFLDGSVLNVVEKHMNANGNIKELAINFLLYGALAEVFARTTGFNKGVIDGCVGHHIGHGHEAAVLVKCCRDCGNVELTSCGRSALNERNSRLGKR